MEGDGGVGMGWGSVWHPAHWECEHSSAGSGSLANLHPWLPSPSCSTSEDLKEAGQPWQGHLLGEQKEMLPSITKEVPVPPVIRAGPQAAQVLTPWW